MVWPLPIMTLWQLRTCSYTLVFVLHMLFHACNTEIQPTQLWDVHVQYRYISDTCIGLTQILVLQTDFSTDNLCGIPKLYDVIIHRVLSHNLWFSSNCLWFFVESWIQCILQCPSILFVPQLIWRLNPTGSHLYNWGLKWV